MLDEILSSGHVSDACQINDFDHGIAQPLALKPVSDACQINDFDHGAPVGDVESLVSDACQINDFDHPHSSGPRRSCAVSYTHLTLPTNSRV